MRQKTRTAVALGANLGDRLATLREAARQISEDVLEGAVFSSVYESEPWGYEDQPRFLNAVLVGDSEWKPPALLNYLKNLEAKLGRTPTFQNGPRVVDLDLICFGDAIWTTEGIEVPHPRMLTRAFVMVPLAEIWPDWVHPEARVRADSIAEKLSGGVTRLPEGLR